MLDPPVIVLQALHKATRRWRLKRMDLLFPQFLPQAPDVMVPAGRAGVARMESSPRFQLCGHYRWAVTAHAKSELQTPPRVRAQTLLFLALCNHRGPVAAGQNRCRARMV